MAKKSLIAAIVLAIWAPALHAVIKRDGESVASLSAASALNTPLGVRSYGMGAAQTGNANDISAVYFNPAGLSQINYFEYGVSYHGAANDVGGHSVMMAIPMPYGTMGVSSVLNTVQDNQYIFGGVNVLPDRNKYSYIANLSYGAPIWARKIHGGVNVKWFGADFDGPGVGTSYPREQKGLFFDLALLGTFDPSHYRESLRWLPRLSAGFTARNLHPLLKLQNEVARSDNREEYNAGVSLHFPYKLMLNFDAVNTFANPTRMRYGLEYWPVHFLAVRGGFSHGVGNDNSKSIHWGVGFGETVQTSKLSFEYAAAKEFPDGVGTNFDRTNSTYHRFAFHHSFESLEVAPNGRVTPVRFTERYTHRYRFARALAPREIIDDSVITLPQETGTYETAITAAEEHNATNPQNPGSAPGSANGAAPAGGANSSQANGQGGQQGQGGGQGQNTAPAQPAPILGRHIVAVFPVGLEVIAGKPKNFSLKEKLRGNFLIEVTRGGAGRLIKADKLAAAPPRNEGELESSYLKRMQQALGADMIVFNKLFVDGISGELKLFTLYYKRGDSTLSAQTEIIGSDGEEADFIRKSTAQFIKDHKAVLEELK